MASFGVLIKDLRLKMRFSQSEMAEKLQPKPKRKMKMEKTVRIDKVQKTDKKQIMNELEAMMNKFTLPVVRSVVNYFFKTDKQRKKNQARIKELRKEIQQLAK